MVVMQQGDGGLGSILFVDIDWLPPHRTDGLLPRPQSLHSLASYLPPPPSTGEQNLCHSRVVSKVRHFLCYRLILFYISSADFDDDKENFWL